MSAIAMSNPDPIHELLRLRDKASDAEAEVRSLRLRLAAAHQNAIDARAMLRRYAPTVEEMKALEDAIGGTDDRHLVSLLEKLRGRS